MLVVRILRALSERNTLTALGSVYLKSEFKTSLYRNLQPLVFVFMFLVKDQEERKYCLSEGTAGI